MQYALNMFNLCKDQLKELPQIIQVVYGTSILTLYGLRS